jgi:hypothetical protein
MGSSVAQLLVRVDVAPRRYPWGARDRRRARSGSVAVGSSAVAALG